MKITCKSCRLEIDLPEQDLRPVVMDVVSDQLYQAFTPSTGSLGFYIFRCSRCGGVHGELSGQPVGTWPDITALGIKMFQDPTSNGQINLRIALAPVNLLSYTDMTETEQMRLIEVLLLCAKKLAAVYKHMRAYWDIERRLIDEAMVKPPVVGGQVSLAIAQDLIIELDEFLVQLKSSLDYLVKTPVPILGPKVWNLRTFGDKGEDVIKALRNNLPKDKVRFAEPFTQLIVQTHQPWLTAVIDARDRLNHMIGEPIDTSHFVVFKFLKDGAEVIHRPMWSPDQPIADFMDTVWDNLIRLFEDFVISFVFMRFKPGFGMFHLPTKKGSNQSPWIVAPEDVGKQITSGPGWRELQSAVKK